MTGGGFYLRGLITGIQKVLRNKQYTVGGSLYPTGLKVGYFLCLQVDGPITGRGEAYKGN